MNDPADSGMSPAVKRILLKPTHSAEPRCSDYSDDSAVRAFERAMREHRARSEPWEILAMDGRVDGRYRIKGSSDAWYDVDIVDGSAQHDACTCPDFLSNDLGTCKHLEAVRRGLFGSRKLASEYAKLAPAASQPTLTVRAVGGLGIVAVGRWKSRTLSSLGVREGEVEIDAQTLARMERRGGVRVVRAVYPACERKATRATLARRTREVSAAISSGRLGTDVVSAKLFPFQRDGVAHLVSSGRALLADDMGLGKTIQSIAACEIMRRRGEAQRILVVTPASLKDQWAREIHRQTGECAMVVGGSPERRRQAFASDAPYKILNYELTWRELEQLQAIDADVLVLDEAQRAKNFRTKTASTLRAIPSRFLFVLTGTPVENRLDDLYSLVQLIDPEVLGPLWQFNLRFHSQDSKGKVVGYKNLTELRKVIAPVVTRRRKEEVLLQLPALTEQTRYTALTAAQRSLDEEHRSEAARLVAIAERRALTKKEQERLMMHLLKARQACNAAELADPSTKKPGSPKLDEFEALVSEIVSQGASKVLVFSEWVEMLKLAAGRLHAMGIGYEMLHGAIPTERRPALLERFRDEPNLQVLLSSDAGGVGLNLQVASYVVHLDLPWNPGKLDQRTARAHRMGQTRGVCVTYLCAEEGMERGIEGTLQGKRAVREAALDPHSDVDSVEAPSFSVFLRQLRSVFEHLAPTGQDVLVEEFPDQPIPSIPALPAAAHPETVPQPSALAPRQPVAQEPHPTQPRDRASDRLRLARLLLQESFPSDAVRASYDALSCAIRSLLDQDCANTHEALVVEIYKQLLPTGRLPVAAHAALARLRDLRTLSEQDVPIDADMARDAVADAEQWVAQLQPPASPAP